MEQSMFETLLALPLFQGLGQADLTRILESTHIDFITVDSGEVICQQDTPCNHIYFVIEGTLVTRTLSADRHWSVVEHITDHAILGLEVLYGRRRTYSSTATALHRSRLLRIDKRTMGALFRYYEVMQINAFNRLTSELDRRDSLLWLPPAATLEGRIVQFCRSHVGRPAGFKRFEISQHTLGQYLGEDQRYIAKALQRLETEGILTRQRRSFEFPAFEQAIAYASQHVQPPRYTP